jgi:hypothetical protein
MIMKKLITSVLLVGVLFGGASISSADTLEAAVPDRSDPYGGYAPNSPEGVRAFWDYQSSHGN